MVKKIIKKGSRNIDLVGGNGRVLTEGEANEFTRCLRSPFYFATKYWTVNGALFTTLLTEDEYNSIFFKYSQSK